MYVSQKMNSESAPCCQKFASSKGYFGRYITVLDHVIVQHLMLTWRIPVYILLYFDFAFCLFNIYLIKLVCYLCTYCFDFLD